MKKNKLLIALLASLMTFSLATAVACGDNGDDSSSTPTSESSDTGSSDTGSSDTNSDSSDTDTDTEPDTATDSNQEQGGK